MEVPEPQLSPTARGPFLPQVRLTAPVWGIKGPSESRRESCHVVSGTISARGT